MKKLISLFLILAMLVPFSPAKATSEPAATPTIEEILNEYHNKAFEASVQGENGAAATWSGRSGDSKTLEQETVEQLTAAGYEAYNVTGENYGAVADALDTDLAAMGLDPEGSYIVVISDVPPGETPDSNAGNNSRVADPPVQEDFDDDDGGGGTTFTYTQDNTTYTMRYVTITAADEYSELFVTADYTLSGISNFDDIVEELATYFVKTAGNKIIKYLSANATEYIPYVDTVCDFIDLILDISSTMNQNPLTLIDPNTMVLRSATAWTRSYIQVYDASSSRWYTAQCSSYAISEASFDSTYIYNSEANAPERVCGIFQDTTTYSPYYNYSAIRFSRAVQGYLNKQTLFDCTGDIHFYLSDPNDDTITIDLFSHNESLAYLLPLFEEE